MSDYFIVVMISTHLMLGNFVIWYIGVWSNNNPSKGLSEMIEGVKAEVR